MIESRTMTGETLEKFRKLLCEEGGLPYGIGRKFENFFNGASKVVFDRESLLAVAIKGSEEEYELDFNVRYNIPLLGYFGAALQKLDDMK